jgi:predicted 3-demethylubiquinone-9 3-methyltransferase (glyoxalase superfamily)
MMSVESELNGRKFLARNGGPEFTFSEAISFQVFRTDQEEVDYCREPPPRAAGGPRLAQE